MSCYTIPQRYQFCSDSYQLEDDEGSTKLYENKEFLKYLSCVDVQGTCGGNRNLVIGASMAQQGIIKTVNVMPDIMNCIWILEYAEDQYEDNIMSGLRESSPLRINIQSAKGVEVYFFQERQTFLKVIPQNITDGDNTFYDIEWEEFRQGQKYYILALKTIDNTNTDFQISFSLNLIKLDVFEWVTSNEDLALIYVAAICLIILCVYAGIMLNQSRLHRLRKASSKLQSKKVKKPRTKKAVKKRSQFQNPYLNQMGGGNGDNNQGEGKGTLKPQKSNIKLDGSMFDKSMELRDLLTKGGQSLRDKIGQTTQKIEDSFFSSENNSSNHSSSDSESKDKIDKQSSNNSRLIQGNEHQPKRVKRIDSNKNSQSGTQSGYGTIQRMQSVRFKNVPDSKNSKRKRNNNYMENTADLTANDIQWINDSQIQDSLKQADIVSQTQGSPPQKNGQLIESSQGRLRKRSPHAMTYKDLYQTQKNSVLALSARRRQQNSYYKQHRNSAAPQVQNTKRLTKASGTSSQVQQFSYHQSTRDRNFNMHQSQGTLSNMSYKSQIQQQVLKNSIQKSVKKRPSPLNLIDSNNRSSLKSISQNTSRSRRNATPTPYSKMDKVSSKSNDLSMNARNLSPPKSVGKNPSNNNITSVLTPLSNQRGSNDNSASGKRRKFMSASKRSKSQQYAHDQDGNLQEVVRNIDADNSLIEEFKFGNEDSNKSSPFTTQQNSTNLVINNRNADNNFFNRNFNNILQVGNLSSSREISKKKKTEGTKAINNLLNSTQNLKKKFEEQKLYDNIEVQSIKTQQLKNDTLFVKNKKDISDTQSQKSSRSKR